jgi:uncharacterized repeat protein (TIGR03803 family)
MKSRTLTCITAAVLLAALAIPVRLAAQEQQEQAPIFTVLHTFIGLSSGAFPAAGLGRDNAGNLYGTTEEGGDSACGSGFSFGCGVVFKLDTTGRETVLHRITVSADGAFPAAGLVRDNAGNLYGTTEEGGDLSCGSGSGFGCGVVFKLDTSGRETVLHRFTGAADGGTPAAGLVRDAAGNLYGTTRGGGDLACEIGFGCGVVFKLDTSGRETVLHRFTGGADGSAPLAGLVRDNAGNLYGTTEEGGELPGVVFKLDTTGKETVLHRFTGGADGGYPAAGLVRDAAGNLYGTTVYGGDLACYSGMGCGVVFKLNP